MAEKLNYFDFAENDYHSLMKSYNAGVTGNFICSNAQKICERYLKHILDKYGDCKDSFVMNSHSLKTLKNKIKTEVPNFKCDWDCVVKADGYYFTNTYPGDDAFFADEDDTRECVAATNATRAAVLEFEKNKDMIESKINIINDITQDADVQKVFSELNNENTEKSQQINSVFDSLIKAAGQGNISANDKESKNKKLNER